MKTPELQIAHFLSAYKESDVINGIRVWVDGLIDGLDRQGWKAQSEKPEGVEFFEVKGTFYVQDKSRKQPFVSFSVCPSCGKPSLSLERICDKRRDNPNGYKILLFCNNTECTYHVYRKEGE